MIKGWVILEDVSVQKQEIKGELVYQIFFRKAPITEVRISQETLDALKEVEKW